MNKLKEHKIFRNQLIIITLILFITSYFIIELLPFGILLGMLSIFNIFTYKENLKDYNNIENDLENR
jgi:predicted glycosyltransferase